MNYDELSAVVAQYRDAEAMYEKRATVREMEIRLKNNPRDIEASDYLFSHKTGTDITGKLAQVSKKLRDLAEQKGWAAAAGNIEEIRRLDKEISRETEAYKALRKSNQDAGYLDNIRSVNGRANQRYNPTTKHDRDGERSKRIRDLKRDIMDANSLNDEQKSALDRMTRKMANKDRKLENSEAENLKLQHELQNTRDTVEKYTGKYMDAKKSGDMAKGVAAIASGIAAVSLIALKVSNRKKNKKLAEAGKSLRERVQELKKKVSDGTITEKEFEREISKIQAEAQMALSETKKAIA